jgi:hypothetical protein
VITDNITAVHKRMGDAGTTLIAVSKKQPDHKIDEALDAGLRVFGENRVQEAVTRWEARKSNYPDLELHLIGPLQTNKVKEAVQLFDVIHTLDREKLAHAIHKHAPDIPCFIQVNVGTEAQKSGVSPKDTNDFYHFCTDLGLHIIGLMCIPPIDEDPAPHFQWMQSKAKELGLKNLSMGMSSDFEKALQYGATHIRVGTDIFGVRL